MDPRTGDPFYGIDTTQSATECTGLMPASPQSPEEAANLSALMAIHCPPDATQEAPSASQSAHADADPSGAHNPPRRRRACHPATAQAPSRPPQGRNP